MSYDQNEAINTFFEKQFQIALQERDYYYHIEGTNAFRLFNAEGDGVGGLTIDNYDGHLLIQWYSKGYISFAIMSLKPFNKYFHLSQFMKNAF